MPAIWTNDGDRWKLTQPDGFPDKATLHQLIEDTPSMLPLAGSPDLVILDSEVQLGTGYADLLAVETTVGPFSLRRSSPATRRPDALWWRSCWRMLLAYTK